MTMMHTSSDTASAGGAGGEDDPRFPPHPFPIGWFQMAYSSDVVPGEVKALHYLGRDLVLWRGEDGVAHVMDAHCAHLGANLAVGGTVEGDSIRCPFHAWRYDGTGVCVEIPYSDRIHPKARVRSHTVIERNGFVMLWWHPLGEPPAWELPTLPEYESDGWTDYRRHEWSVATHWQEVLENAVDTSHFHYMHGTEMVPTISDFEIGGPLLRVNASHIFRTPMGPKPGFIDTHMYGPGWGTVRIRIEGLTEILFPQAMTPVDVGRLHMTFSFMAKGRGARARVGNGLSTEIITQIDADAPIWEHKLFRPVPRLADGDGPVMAFRRWAEMFYTPEHFARMQSASRRDSMATAR
jgi:3-ketosteroid 9alpha-monooxygenase subunit A